KYYIRQCSIKNFIHNFSLFTIGRNKNDKPPKTITKTVCEVQRIQPKAVPAVNEIPYNAKILAISKGKAPIPPLVKLIARLPTTKATIVTPSDIVLVSGNTLVPK